MCAAGFRTTGDLDDLGSLAIMAGLVSTLTVDHERMRAAAAEGLPYPSKGSSADGP